MFWVNLFIKVISVLHSDESPRSLAAGFALGLIIGLTPLLSAHNVIIVIIMLLLNVSISAALFGIFLFSAVAFFFEPIFHNLGYFLLVNLTFLKPLWTYLYNIPIAPLFRLNNTVVLGSLIVSCIAFIPVYLGFQKVVKLYKLHLKERVEQLKIIKMINANNLVQWIQKIRSMGV